MSDTKGEMLPMETFGEFVKRRFTDGLLRHGAHNPDGLACVLEARNVALMGKWHDEPGGFPDLRPLNDARWSSDKARTENLIPVIEALWDWDSWSKERQQKWAKAVCKRLIQEILPPMLENIGLIKEADRCRYEGSSETAWAAAGAASEMAWAASETARAAAWEAACETARAAARAAAWEAAARAASETARAAAKAAACETARAAARAAACETARAAAGAAVSEKVLVSFCQILKEEALNSHE